MNIYWTFYDIKGLVSISDIVFMIVILNKNTFLLGIHTEMFIDKLT